LDTVLHLNSPPGTDVYKKYCTNPGINVVLKDFEKPISLQAERLGTWQYDLRDDTTVTQAGAIAAASRGEFKTFAGMLFGVYRKTGSEVQGTQCEAKCSKQGIEGRIAHCSGRHVVRTPKTVVSKHQAGIPYSSVGAHGTQSMCRQEPQGIGNMEDLKLNITVEKESFPGQCGICGDYVSSPPA